ncbi:inner membrane protein [Neolewinella xylanilytica]|uniref:Inner membrane protein n=1 Tax=Neolewinella xylanilytica TaxID=1514080 RepID=A0A2S6I1G3_9BACT|nr:metal-dependent hydrolase [Neolewinella xylanilytica]PPK84796.1 inner membrane protein [Neolewinella xylanilytica]
MDSLTQVVLGAAVGEAVLGRKVGNRAMVWGGLAGTLPDLDVLSGLVTDPMSALAYHRAFTHSLPFAVLAAPVIGLAVHHLYGGRDVKVSGKLLYPAALLAFWLILLVGSYLMPIQLFAIPAIVSAITLVFTGLSGLIVGIHVWRGTRTKGSNATFLQWTLLFFLAIVTHPLLDCFTSYGTQFLEPFSSVRLAWNTVSVIDPLYTFPFLLLLLLAARQGRRARVRRNLNRAGLLISSAYLFLTVVNAVNVGGVVDNSLQQHGIGSLRSIHSPTLGNNLLWSATIQTTNDTFYLGQYSLLDSTRTLNPLLPIAGNHRLLVPYSEDRELEILTWFTDGYYTVLPGGAGRVVLCDLRYGLLGRDPSDPGSYTFNWTIDTTRRPVRVVVEAGTSRPEPSGALKDLWSRMLGK